jgi:hypothetical protein
LSPWHFDPKQAGSWLVFFLVLTASAGALLWAWRRELGAKPLRLPWRRF